MRRKCVIATFPALVRYHMKYNKIRYQRRLLVDWKEVIRI